MLKLFGRNEIQISSFNLTKQELFDFIHFWEDNKHLSTIEFVDELFNFIDQHQNRQYEDCTIDMSSNEVSLSRRTIL